MEIIKNIRLKTQCSDLKDLSVDHELLDSALRDRNFIRLYKK